MRSLWSLIGACLLLGLMQAAPSSYASTVTINATAINAIFSQPSFGDTPIDIVFLDPRSYNPYLLRPYDPALQSIDTAADLQALDTIASTTFRIVDLFFVDDLSYCGGPGASIVGCGNPITGSAPVESASAASDLGSALIAHELGHILGLQHASSEVYLMYPYLLDPPGTLLNTYETAAMLRSPWLNGGSTLRVQPWFNVTPVPLPAALPLLGAGLAGFGAMGWIRRRCCKHE